MIFANKKTYEARHDDVLWSATTQPTVHHRVATVGSEVISYLEAGDRHAAVLLIVAGRTEPEQLSRLVAGLADRYRVICPVIVANEPGHPSEMHNHSQDRVISGLLNRLCIQRFALYLIDAGIAAGWQVAAKDPSRLTSLIVQTDREAFGRYVCPRDENTEWADESNQTAAGRASFVNELREALADWSSQTKPPMLFLWSANEPQGGVGGTEPYIRPLPAIELHISSDERGSQLGASSGVRPRVSEFLARHDLREQPEYLSL
jgi:hypothetical protein